MNEKSVESVATLKELKATFGKDLEGIKALKGLEWYEVMKDVASNFIRMVAWKKEKDLPYIKTTYIEVLGKVIEDIHQKTFSIALKDIKNNDLHKAYNIKYIYAYYGLDFTQAKNDKKMIRKNILG